MTPEGITQMSTLSYKVVYEFITSEKVESIQFEDEISMERWIDDHNAELLYVDVYTDPWKLTETIKFQDNKR